MSRRVFRTPTILLEYANSNHRKLQMGYSMVRFWSYIFTPLLILVLVFAMFVIFSLSASQITVGSLIAPALAVSTSVLGATTSVVGATKAANYKTSFSPIPVGK